MAAPLSGVSGEGFTPAGFPNMAGSGIMDANLAKLAMIPPPVSTPSAGSVAPTAAANTGLAIQTGQQVNSQLPGYNQSVGNIGANIQSETAGQLPADVINQITQQGAERGISTGSAGSPNSGAAFEQALGLNSLALTQTGQGNLQSMLPSLPGASISQNPGFYTSVGQQYEQGTQNGIFQGAASAANAAGAAGAAGFAAGNAGGGGGAPSVPGGLPPTPGGSADDFMNSPDNNEGSVTGNAPDSAGTVTGGNSSLDTLDSILQQYGGGNTATQTPM